MNYKPHKDLFIAWLSMGLLGIVLGVVFFDSYYGDKVVFVARVENCLEESVQQLCSESMEDPRGVTLSRDDTTLFIVKGGVEYVFRLDTMMSINNNIFRAAYDVRNLEHWNLERLAAIFREKMAEACPPFVFIRMDSTGNRLECQGYQEGDGEGREKHTILLGFLDGHQLTVCFAFTWSYFLLLEWKKLLIVFLLLSLVATCVVLFVRIVRDGRKRIEQRELLAQALNHDLKAPIAELQLMSYLIKSHSVVEYSVRQQELYRDSQKKTGEILGAIDRLLLDSVEDVRGLCLRLEPVDLPLLLEKQISDLLAFVAEKKHVEVVPLFQMPCPVIQGDGYHLSRAISNLLRNAVKYSGEKLVVRVTCRRVGRFVEIIIEDDGYGIEKADLKNIFVKNFRAGFPAEDKKINGFGIGLSYVKMIVKAHGGTIHVVSEPGKGSVFTIRFKIGKDGRKN